MGAKACSTKALSGCLAASVTTATAGLGPRVWADYTNDGSSDGLWSGVVIWCVGPREEGVEERPKREEERHHQSPVPVTVLLGAQL